MQLRRCTVASHVVLTAILRRKAIEIRKRLGVGLTLVLVTACGPRAHIPLRPANLPGVLAPTDSGTLLARRLAPVLYLQKDETFPLERVVAVLHPNRPIIAYHLLWRDDVHGSWIPFTVPTDDGFDVPTGSPGESGGAYNDTAYGGTG